MTANIQIKIQCPMTCCLSFSLLPVSMNQKTHVSLTQFPVRALPGACHSLPSCLFLLRLVWASSCGLPLRPESLVSDSPGLCLAPGAVCHTDSPWAAAWLPAPVSVSPGAPPAPHRLCGLALTPRPRSPGPIQLSPLQIYLSFLTSLLHSLTVSKIPWMLPNLQKKAGL